MTPRKIFRVFSAILAMLLCAGTHAFGAGKTRPRYAFDRKSNTMAFAATIGNAQTYGSEFLNHVGFLGFYERGIFNAGHGTVGLGATIGYVYADRTGYYGQKEKWSNTLYGIRATYHLDIEGAKHRLDPYFGIVAGLRREQHNDDAVAKLELQNHFLAGPFIGLKYLPAPGFGPFAEAGYDLSWFRLGLHFSF